MSPINTRQLGESTIIFAEDYANAPENRIEVTKTGIRRFGNMRRWDDMVQPFIGSALDSSSGRIDYDFDEICIGYQANARYPQEPVCFPGQLPHAWSVASEARPHLHWFQEQAGVPNWLMEYRLSRNGQLVPGTWTQVPWSENEFTYASGTLLQITDFPAIDLSAMNVSDCLDIKIYRDSANASGLFAGADPVGTTALAKFFDPHLLFDDIGSEQEYVK